MIEESIIPQIEGFELISANYEENPDFHDALLVDFRAGQKLECGAEP